MSIEIDYMNKTIKVDGDYTWNQVFTYVSQQDAKPINLDHGPASEWVENALITHYMLDKMPPGRVQCNGAWKAGQ